MNQQEIYTNLIAQSLGAHVVTRRDVYLKVQYTSTEQRWMRTDGSGKTVSSELLSGYLGNLRLWAII